MRHQEDGPGPWSHPAFLSSGSCTQSASNRPLFAPVQHSHDRPAHETDKDHERPARQQSKPPQDVPHRDIDPKLRERPVERMEQALVRWGLLVRLLRMDLHDLLGRHCRRVQRHRVDRRRRLALIRGRDRQPHVVDRRRARQPRRAQDGLGLAIDVAQVRRGRVGGEDGGGFVPRALDVTALAEAGLVATGDQDHPVLRAGGGGRGGAGLEDGFPVVVGERDDVLGGNGGGAGGDGGGERGGEVGLGFFEVGLEVHAEEAHGFLVLRESEGRGKEEEGGGETHVGGWGIESMGEVSEGEGRGGWRCWKSG